MTLTLTKLTLNSNGDREICPLFYFFYFFRLDKSRQYMIKKLFKFCSKNTWRHARICSKIIIMGEYYYKKNKNFSKQCVTWKLQLPKLFPRKYYPAPIAAYTKGMGSSSLLGAILGGCVFSSSPSFAGTESFSSSILLAKLGDYQ